MAKHHFSLEEQQSQKLSRCYDFKLVEKIYLNAENHCAEIHAVLRLHVNTFSPVTLPLLYTNYDSLFY